jgi:hypothetical protein
MDTVLNRLSLKAQANYSHFIHNFLTPIAIKPSAAGLLLCPIAPTAKVGV